MMQCEVIHTYCVHFRLMVFIRCQSNVNFEYNMHNSLSLAKSIFLNSFNMIPFFFAQDNPHKLTLVMTPDATYEERRITKETEKLNSMVTQLSEVEKDNIYKQGLLTLFKNN